MKTETMLEYVIRKLNNDAFNKSEISRKTGVSKATMSEIASGKNHDPRSSTIQKLYEYFVSLNE